MPKNLGEYVIVHKLVHQLLPTMAGYSSSFYMPICRLGRAGEAIAGVCGEEVEKVGWSVEEEGRYNLA